MDSSLFHHLRRSETFPLADASSAYHDWVSSLLILLMRGNVPMAYIAMAKEVSLRGPLLREDVATSDEEPGVGLVCVC